MLRDIKNYTVSSDLQFAKMPTTLKGETILWCDKVGKKKDSVISEISAFDQKKERVDMLKLWMERSGNSLNLPT